MFAICTTCFTLKYLKFPNMFVGCHSPAQEGKATQGQKPADYCTKKPATVS